MSQIPSMSGKIILITAGTGGIGKATATGLAKMGRTIIIVGRDKDRGEAAVAEIKAKSDNPAVELLLADLSSQKEIRRAAQDFMSRYDRLDVLVNNVGGLYGKRWETAEGVEMTLALNHLCPFLLTHLLLPMLKASAPSRIINVNSEGHRAVPGINFNDLQTVHWKRGFRVYSQAKLANLMFTYELARRLSGTGVTVNALHPGIVDTQLFRRFISERFFPNSKYFSTAASFLLRRLAYLRLKFSDIETAAQPSIYLASSDEVEGVTGKYFNDKKEIVESSPASYDEAAARRLWQVTAELTGLTETTII